MGFFTDLKEDLSQAVNELVPEEEKNNTSEVVEEVTESEVNAGDEISTEDKAPASVDELSAMLDKVDERTPVIETPVLRSESKSELKNDIMSALKSASDETAVITAGMTIKGDVTSEGSMELVGSIIGNIDICGKLNITGNVEGNSKAAEVYADNAKINGEIFSSGSVKIGQSSVIIGNIAASSAVIAGAVKGDIDVHGPVVLDTSAIVMGNIKSKSVQINNGAVIEGLCSQCYADVNPTSFFDDIKKK